MEANVNIVVPSFGSSITEGTLIEWLVGPGSNVRAGDPIAVVETDKVNTEIEAPCDGVIESLVVEPGAEIAPGAVVATMAT
jgi:pyruvate dehydrogenase E2 component (dihydrolipoamide acetyltransferase)